MKRAPAPEPPEASRVKAVNIAYYKALSARDMCAMEKVWTCASDNILIAPPINPRTHVGWTAIKRNWEIYWPTFDKFSVSMTVTAVNINGPVAWVHGIEPSHRRTKTGDVSSSRNYGTNIFVKHEGRWLMAFHQSALIPRKFVTVATAGAIMGESKPERVPVVCEECRFYVGSLTPNARGRLMEFVRANDSNCKHPPAATCPYLLMAFSKVRAAARNSQPAKRTSGLP